MGDPLVLSNEHACEFHPMTDTGSDDELLKLARQGDASAFGRLVRRHEAAVAAVVIGMLGPGDDADDVGQETFIRFHAALATFRGEASLRTYLQAIAMNLSRNALKRRRRSALRLISRDHAITALNEPTVDAFNPETGERISVVRQAIATLDERHRSVVVLRLLVGLSTKDTATMLQLPQGTVMSRLARGITTLQQRLAWYTKESGGRPDA
jgi:RNA polymerase sigma-70 factor (ECF subfamily)